MAWVAEVATYEDGKVVALLQKRCLFRLGALDFAVRHAQLTPGDRRRLARERVITVPGGQKSVIVASVQTAARRSLSRRGLLAALAGAGLLAFSTGHAVPALAQTAPASGRDALDRPVAVRTSWIVTQVTVWSDGELEIGNADTLTARSARQLADRLANLEEADRRASVAAAGETVTMPRTVADALAGRGAPAPQTPPTAAAADLNAPGRHCAATAVSTGKPCRNWALQGSAYCGVHRTDPGIDRPD